MSNSDEKKIKNTNIQKQPLKNRPLPTIVTQDVTSVVPSVVGVLDDDKNNLDVWVEQIYTLTISDQELLAMYNIIRYKGFNREEVLGQMKRKFANPKDVIKIIILCNLQGPQRAAITPFDNNTTLASIGIPATGGQGKQMLTCNKIGAATADIAAYYLKRLKVPKKINIDCPGWLQFPAAASIEMPQHFRDQHIEFSRRFSALIGGEFREDLYNTMIVNAYYDKRLQLF